MQKVNLNSHVGYSKSCNFKSNDSRQKNRNQSSSSSNGTALMLLTSLATAAVAGIALYKNHSISKDLKSITKKLNESEEKLQTVIENQEKTIQEGINKALKNNEKNVANNNNVKKQYSKKTTGSKIFQSRKAPNSNESKQNISEGTKYLEEQEQLALQEKHLSDLRNQEWLKQQRKQQEKEYSEMFNKAMNEKEVAEGTKYLEEQEQLALQEKHLSDLRNQEWVRQQHKQQTKDYNAWVEEHKEAFDAIEQEVDEKLARDAKHNIIQSEYNKMFEEQKIKIKYYELKANVKHGIKNGVSKLKKLFSKE